MPSNAFIIYKQALNFAGLEPGTKYHRETLTGWGGVAADLAAAEAELCSNAVTFTRYEYFNSEGQKIDEGPITGISGLTLQEMMPFKYAILLRMNVTGTFLRPSSRYIHGYPETFTTGGIANNALTAALIAYDTALDAIGGITDSNSLPLENHTFRGFTKRKRVRRVII